jgi:hypothetical protein
MPKKVEKYIEERKEILRKLLEILEISETNKMFSLRELDENEEKQEELYKLVPEIKKYYICSKWSYFMHKDREEKRKYLSLIKSIFKHTGIQIESVFKKNKSDKRETYYVVLI